MRWLAAGLALMVLISTPGCGGDDGSGATPAGAAEPAKLFADTCGSCHALAAARTDGAAGPDLDRLRPDLAQVRTAIVSGPGAMPPGLLGGTQVDSVARYVAQNAGR